MERRQQDRDGRRRSRDMRRDGVRAGVAAAVCALALLPALSGGAVGGAVEDLLLTATIRTPERPGPVKTRPGTAWDSCQEIPVRVNAPEHLMTEIADALDELNRAAGARFRIVGASARVPQADWARNGERSEGRRWPDVIIAVARTEATDLLGPGDRGAAVANPLGERYVTGAVVIEMGAADLWSREGNLRRLLLHELGHLAGLDHSGDGIMHPHVRRSGGADGYSDAEQAAMRQNFVCLP